MVTTIEVLKAARQLISDPAHWTQGTFARDKDGFIASPREPDAVCFCAVGAIIKAGIETPYIELSRSVINAFDVDESFELTIINDRSSHDAVLSMFDKAIERATQ